LIQDQGEVAITLVEDGNGGFTCESYAIPENGNFEQEELRNLYLLQALKEENTVKEGDHPSLVNYLGKYLSKINQRVGGTQTAENMMNVIYDHENKVAPRTNEEEPLETRETFFTKKYKPVAQKIRPV